jgi:hypothetical protein
MLKSLRSTEILTRTLRDLCRPRLHARRLRGERMLMRFTEILTRPRDLRRLRIRARHLRVEATRMRPRRPGQDRRRIHLRARHLRAEVDYRPGRDLRRSHLQLTLVVTRMKLLRATKHCTCDCFLYNGGIYVIWQPLNLSDNAHITAISVAQQIKLDATYYETATTELCRHTITVHDMGTAASDSVLKRDRDSDSRRRVQKCDSSPEVVSARHLGQTPPPSATD